MTAASTPSAYGPGVDPRQELRDFLGTRRARVTPDQAGLPALGGTRRVAGLRREEVALLAGISVEYYTRLERGTVGEVSEPVLEGVARALQLDEAERDHLHALARAIAGSRPGPRRPTRTRVRPTLQRVLDQLGGPAFVRNGRLDLLAANAVGRALYAPVYESPARTREGLPNTAVYCFLDPGAADFFVDWDRVSEDAVAVLRAEAGRDPYGAQLQEVVGLLSTRSERFRRLWAAHDVRYHRTGHKRLHHPLVGDLDLDYEALAVTADEGQQVNVYSAAADTPTAERLALLASWGTPTVDAARIEPGAPRVAGE